MAHGGIEIEIKVPTDKKNFIRIKNHLDKTSKFITEIHHIDTYYSPAHIDFLEPDVPYRWLSIRNRGKNTILCYKHWHKNKKGEFAYCDEAETKVESKGELERIMKAIDMKELVVVDKKRWKYIFNGVYEISMDQVKDLGYFVEIESLKDLGGVEKTREKLFKLAQKLGLDTSKDVPGGYAFALIKQNK